MICFEFLSSGPASGQFKTYYCSGGVAWIFRAWGFEKESGWFRQWMTRDWEEYSLRGDQAGVVAGGGRWCLLALGVWSMGWDPEIGVQREDGIPEQCCLAGVLASRDCLWTLRLSLHLGSESQVGLHLLGFRNSGRSWMIQRGQSGGGGEALSTKGDLGLCWSSWGMLKMM